MDRYKQVAGPTTVDSMERTLGFREQYFIALLPGDNRFIEPLLDDLQRRLTQFQKKATKRLPMTISHLVFGVAETLWRAVIVRHYLGRSSKDDSTIWKLIVTPVDELNVWRCRCSKFNYLVLDKT